MTTGVLIIHLRREEHTTSFVRASWQIVALAINGVANQVTSTQLRLPKRHKIIITITGLSSNDGLLI